MGREAKLSMMISRFQKLTLVLLGVLRCPIPTFLDGSEIWRTNQLIMAKYPCRVVYCLWCRIPSINHRGKQTDLVRGVLVSSLYNLDEWNDNSWG